MGVDSCSLGFIISTLLLQVYMGVYSSFLSSSRRPYCYRYIRVFIALSCVHHVDPIATGIHGCISSFSGSCRSCGHRGSGGDNSERVFIAVSWVPHVDPIATGIYG